MCIRDSLGSLLFTSVEAQGPFSAQIQRAVATITRGALPFTGFTATPGHWTFTVNDAQQTDSGAYGPFLNKLSTVAAAHALTWQVDGTPKWAMGVDSGGVDFVYLYDHTLPGDVFRIAPASTTGAGAGTLFELNSVGAGAPATNDSALYIRAGTNKGALKLFVTGNIPNLAFVQNTGGSKRTKIQWGGTYQMGTDINQNNTDDFWIYDGAATRYAITSTATTITGPLVTSSTVSMGAPIVTAGTDATITNTGDVVQQRYQATITPASGGAGNCETAFKAGSTTADCTVATIPAGMQLVKAYADVTAGFTCSGTCTGTKVFQCGTAVNGTQVFAASLNVAATGQFGLADANMGSGLTRAAAIQGGLLPSWASTTAISCRFTSGTGNWGNGSATFVNAGSIKFTFITEQIK